MSATSSLRPSPSRLAEARALSALTQEELARKAKLSLSSVGKYERGERSPRGPQLRRIARVTGFPVDWFFDLEAVAGPLLQSGAAARS